MQVDNVLPEKSRRFTGFARRVVTGTLAVAALVTAGQFVHTPPAAAAQFYEIKNFHTQLCLDDSARGLRTLACNGTSHQDWLAPVDSTGQIKNRNTGRCVADSFVGGLRTVTCGDFASQRWYSYRDDSRRYLIFQGGSSYGCLDDSRQFRLRTFGCNGLRWQLWDVRRA